MSFAAITVCLCRHGASAAAARGNWLVCFFPVVSVNESMQMSQARLVMFS